jgi:hypothetical protein
MICEEVIYGVRLHNPVLHNYQHNLVSTQMNAVDKQRNAFCRIPFSGVLYFRKLEA